MRTLCTCPTFLRKSAEGVKLADNFISRDASGAHVNLVVPDMYVYKRILEGDYSLELSDLVVYGLKPLKDHLRVTRVVRARAGQFDCRYSHECIHPGETVALLNMRERRSK
ncbi:hypothetical protein PM082_016017 [Marasmius tenuissimus]|nr:hypothetical protein PM082_016017 [Marasmius tenuissimus]